LPGQDCGRRFRRAFERVVAVRCTNNGPHSQSPIRRRCSHCRKSPLKPMLSANLKGRDHASFDLLPAFSGTIPSRAVFPARPVEMSRELLRRARFGRYKSWGEAPDRHLRKWNFHYLIWKVEPVGSTFSKCGEKSRLSTSSGCTRALQRDLSASRFGPRRQRSCLVTRHCRRRHAPP
jgi:hypothetical protein